MAMWTSIFTGRTRILNIKRTVCAFGTIMLYTALFCLTIAFGYSQKTIKSGFKNNEAKLNMLYLPGGYGELSYERILSRKSAFGVSIGLFMDSAGPNYATDILTYDFGVLPYFRYYFGHRRAAGFFLESNMLVFSRKGYGNGKEQWGLGLGLALGVKLLNKKDWSIDIVLGGGGIFEAHNDSDDLQAAYVDLNFPDLYPRLGIAIGKRF